MADIAFVNDEVETAKPMESFEPIPPGEYVAAILESEVVETGNGTGQQLKLKWKVLEGDYSGRLVFDRVTLRNPTAKAVEIGMRQLKSVSLAVGHTGRLADSAALHGIPCSIKVKIKPAGTNQTTGKSYEAGNEIRDYKALTSAPSLAVQQAAAGGAVASPPPTQRAAAPAAPSATVNAPRQMPWERKAS